MKVKQENAKAGLLSNVKKTKTMTTEETHNFHIGNEDTEIKIVLTWVQSSVQMETAAKKPRDAEGQR